MPCPHGSGVSPYLVNINVFTKQEGPLNFNVQSFYVGFHVTGMVN